MRFLTFFAVAGLATADTLEPDRFETETVVVGGQDITQFDIAADNGAAGVPAQRGERSIVLRTRQQRACFFDRAHRAVSQDNLDQGGQVARISAGGWIAFDRVRLDEISGLRFQCWPRGSGLLTLSVRTAPEDPALGSVGLPPGRDTAAVIAFTAKTTGGHDVSLTVIGNADAIADVMRLGFCPGVCPAIAVRESSGLRGATVLFSRNLRASRELLRSTWRA